MIEDEPVILRTAEYTFTCGMKVVLYVHASEIPGSTRDAGFAADRILESRMNAVRGSSLIKISGSMVL